MYIKKPFTAVLAGLVLVWGMQSHALEIDDPNTDADWTSNETSNLDSNDLETITGISDLILGYKAEFNDPIGEEGLFADYYETIFTFENTDTAEEDPVGAVIEWPERAPSDFITCPECILVVKDGAADPSEFLFNIGDWNGQDQITLDNFWAGQRGAISNVAIWFADVTTAVPEPGTLSLMVIVGGLILSAGARRRYLVSK